MYDNEILILGTNGNIARALTHLFPNSTKVPRKEYISWLQHDQSKFASFLQNLKVQPNFIFNCVGVTDSSRDYELLLKINLELPKMLLSALHLQQTKFVTFGTVMENIEKYSLTNNYLKSKLLYFNWLNSSNSNPNYLHCQLHTLYGGQVVHKHMFLGQILKALREKSKFSMSAGKQFREYHHINDDISAVIELLQGEFLGSQAVTHGTPVSLKDLADSIFDHFDCQELLEVGSFETSQFDTTKQVFFQNEGIKRTTFRESKSGIIEWLSANL